MPDKYILDGKTPKPTSDLMEWAKWFETADRHVAKVTINDRVVSTVFLGLDHAFGGAKPLLFETMIFGVDGGGEKFQERCSTWEEAEKMHAHAVAIAKDKA